ncbi:hypothetical protein HPB50_023954 [Hyalomma asiaticum]|uniref:Uncharacterized protein n=1 Tax=Hyalomma asiaticum TaxID=266040 RepID=A0ACB7S346_HYAAI|nr:hypothetical protein HPB50_023954 [Hyalomma asiaticum]
MAKRRPCAVLGCRVADWTADPTRHRHGVSPYGFMPLRFGRKKQRPRLGNCGKHWSSDLSFRVEWKQRHSSSSAPSAALSSPDGVTSPATPAPDAFPGSPSPHTTETAESIGTDLLYEQSSTEGLDILSTVAAELRTAVKSVPLPPAPVNREASPSTPQAALDAIASAATFPTPQESPDLTDGCSQPCGPASVPLPQKSDTEVEIMDTSSSRKRPRPTENTSDDEGSSRKLPAVTPAPESGTPPPVEASAVLHDADDGFQTVQSKSQKRRQRAAAAAGTAARCVPPSGSTHSGSSAAAAAPPAVVTTTPTSVSTRASPQQCGITVLFRPAIPGATFPRTSRLSLAQALSALPGVQEVRVNTKKNVVAADATTPDWRDRLLATTELAGIPVNARMPADRTQSSGIVQGILGNYTEEELLAGVQSDVPVLAAKRQGRRSFCALQHRLRLPRSASFGWSMLFELVGRAPCSA